ncbi:ArdC-like ssDNA-binding domain-containing protein [Sphingobium scionense]
MGYQDKTARLGGSLYSEVTDRIVAQIEEGTLPWVRPWDNGKAALGLPRNAGTGRRYSGINVLILWHRLFEQGYGSQRWLTYRQAQALGGNVRKGEQGTTVCYVSTQSSLRGVKNRWHGSRPGRTTRSRPDRMASSDRLRSLNALPSSTSTSARGWRMRDLRRSRHGTRRSSSRAQML